MAFGGSCTSLYTVSDPLKHLCPSLQMVVVCDVNGRLEMGSCVFKVIMGVAGSDGAM